METEVPFNKTKIFDWFLLHKFKQEKILPSLPISPIQAQNGIVENKPLQMLICKRWIILKNSIMAACCLGKMTKSTIEWLLTLLMEKNYFKLTLD